MFTRATRVGFLLFSVLAVAVGVSKLLGVLWHGGMLVFASAEHSLYLADVGTGIAQPLTTDRASTRFELSPQGTELIFSNGEDIFVLTIPDGRQRRLSETAFRDANPAWSPDGQRIAFVAAQAGASRIYVTDSHNPSPALLSLQSVNDFAPAWSPDGAQIAFISTRHGWPQVFVIAATGGEARNLSLNHYVDYFAWSPNGDTIAFIARTDTDTEIYSVRLADAVAVNLSQSGANDYLFAWSPDGTQIIFSSLRDRGRAQLYAVHPDGSDLHALSDGTSHDLMPRWSPDGSAIAYLCGARLNALDICLMDADGSHYSISDSQFYNLAPSWSPDGTQMAFLSTRDGSLQLYMMDVYDRANVRRLTTFLPLVNVPPIWNPLESKALR